MTKPLNPQLTRNAQWQAAIFRKAGLLPERAERTLPVPELGVELREITAAGLEWPDADCTRNFTRMN
jgi:hypothetical protein